MITKGDRNKEIYQLAENLVLDEVIGITEFALTRAQSESPMNNLICDAMVTATAADFSFTNFVKLGLFLTSIKN